jgi:DNA polymerase-3 subunit epsilon
MDFTSIDVETANPDLSSICQIGVVQFTDGAVSHRWKSYVNPHDYFAHMNTSVHGITEDHVSDAPTFVELHDTLSGYLTSSVVCCHTTFDRTAIRAAHAKHDLELPDISWLDTARVVQRTWLDRSRSGYGLRSVAEMLGIDFKHHDAEEDARAAGEILLRAIAETGMSVSDWFERHCRAITRGSSGTSVRLTRDGNREGSLCSETAVFTGALLMPRREAAALAAEAGCDIGTNVTKSTTLLIVGDQDVTKLAGHSKSSKHRKAEANIAKGQDIRILRETDFLMLLDTSHNKMRIASSD